MAGLILLSVALIWLMSSIYIAGYVSKRIFSGWARFISALVLAPTILIAPFFNQIVGWFQFEDYCKAAESITVLDSIPAPKGLYTSAGEWRLAKFDASKTDEYTKLVHFADSFLRWETGDYVENSNWTHVGKRETKIYEKNSNHLLAQWTSYSFKGGLSSLMGSTTECHPKLLDENGYGLYKQIFNYQN